MKETKHDERKNKGRVIVIGGDGLDAALLKGWLQQGELPHLAKLSELGGWSPLQTTNPAESPVAWASFATGLNPGKHGIFDFLHRDPQTYRPYVGPLAVRLRPDGRGLQVTNRRRGETMWSIASAAGKSCCLLRVPGTCPPEPVLGKMLSGLGVPDLLGTWGSSSLFTSAAGHEDRSRRIIAVPYRDGWTETAIIGPQDIHLPLQLKIEKTALHLRCQAQEHRLQVGEWSPWISLQFPAQTGFQWHAIARFYLRSLYPDLQLYLSPLHIDPRHPCLLLTYPASYADELVAEHGLFSTLGWPEDATGLEEGRLDEDGFLYQVYEAFSQQEAMTLSEMSKGGAHLLISVFEATDRLQHTFWRYQDPSHPLYQPETRYGHEILRCYQRLDSLVGKVLARLGPEDTLLVMSDHGFKPVYKLVNLNRWLLDHGYLVLRRDNKGTGGFGSDVDWGRTQAYAVGLSKLFINLRGRERQGIVEKGRDYDELCERIAQELLALQDPETGTPVVRNIYLRNRLYKGPATEEAGDLVVGFYEGYRTSQQSAIGGTASPVISANRRKWSADHCSIDPPLVPGVLLCNRPLDLSAPSILDLAPTILDLLGLPIPANMDGRSLLAS